MKTAAKVFIILGMIFGFYLIFPIVIGAITLKKLKTATKKDDVKTWGIVSLIFCNIIGGILILCLQDSDFAPAEVAAAQAAPAEESNSDNSESL